MTRGNNNDGNRGRGRGFRGRGQSQGNRGRAGGSPFRGRGQAPRGAGRPNYHSIDIDIQQWNEETPLNPVSPYAQRGRGGKVNVARGRGRGSGMSTPNYVVYNNNTRTPPPPRVEGGTMGYGTPTGRGRPRGGGLGAKFNPQMSLSKLLSIDRPFLRPITFVPAQLTPVLFKEEEELIQVEPFIEPEDHVPTADQVARIFTHQKQKQKHNPAAQPTMFDNPNDDLFELGDESAPIASVDFRSLGDFMEQTIQVEETESGPSGVTADIEVSQITVHEEHESSTAAISTEIAVDAETVREGSNIIENEGAGETSKAADNTLTAPGLIVASTSESSAQEFFSASESPTESDAPQIFLDATPSLPGTSSNNIDYTVSATADPLGSALPDDDVVIYDAPLPRSREATPNVFTSALPSSSKDRIINNAPPTSTTSQNIEDLTFRFSRISDVTQANRDQIQSATPRKGRLTKKNRQHVNRVGKRGFFGSYGAMLEEKHLHEAEDRRKRRQGSDIDWGGSDSDDQVSNKYLVESDIERVSSSLGAMDIDSDINMKGMQSFVKSMSVGGMEETRIDDIEDEERLRMEDEESDSDASSAIEEDSEIEAVFNAELDALVGEEGEYGEKSDYEDAEDEDDDDDDDSDEDEDEVTPRRKWQADLDKVRQKAKGKMKASAETIVEGSPGGLFQGRMATLRGRAVVDSEEDGEDDHDDFDEQFAWLDGEGDLVDEVQMIIDENEMIARGRNRKERNALFKSIRDGDFVVSPAKKRKDKGKDLPPELHSLWENDRAKKAERKRQRALARQQLALDPFAKHKGGKKGRKAMLTALRHATTDADVFSDSDTDAIRNPAPDIPTLITEIRLYLSDMGNKAPMSLPPMDKTSRARVHEIAEAFGLKSKSIGKGEARYTRLIKTSRSGLGVNERKISRIVRSSGDWGFSRAENCGKGGGGGKGGGAPRHKEGDEVGKAAPKIGEGNVGFKMLAGMGWAEGQRIGVSGNRLDAPLTAIIKNTKLGLGATR